MTSFKDLKYSEQSDLMRELCIRQGYVPTTCQLQGMLVFALVNKGEDPCARCNMDRDICKGRPRTDGKDPNVYDTEFQM